MYIVELYKHKTTNNPCWLANSNGWKGITYNKINCKEYTTIKGAKSALTRFCNKNRTLFPDAKILEIKNK
jgi:hypothetical protein